MKRFNRLTAVLLAGVTAASLTGGAVSVFADSDVKVIKGVTSGSLAPYFYVGDDNELTGVLSMSFRLIQQMHYRA